MEKEKSIRNIVREQKCVGFFPESHLEHKKTTTMQRELTSHLLSLYRYSCVKSVKIKKSMAALIQARDDDGGSMSHLRSTVSHRLISTTPNTQEGRGAPNGVLSERTQRKT